MILQEYWLMDQSWENYLMRLFLAGILVFVLSYINALPPIEYIMKDHFSCKGVSTEPKLEMKRLALTVLEIANILKDIVYVT